MREAILASGRRRAALRDQINRARSCMIYLSLVGEHVPALPQLWWLPQHIVLPQHFWFSPQVPLPQQIRSSSVQKCIELVLQHFCSLPQVFLPHIPPSSSSAFARL